MAAAALHRTTSTRRFIHRSLPYAFLTVGSLAGVLVAAQPQSLRIVTVGVTVLTLIAVGVRAPRPLLYCLVIWLPMLGLVRRLLSSISPAGQLGDPLLLIGPAVVCVLLLAATRAGAPRARSPLANAVLALTVLALGSAVNPLQGSLMIGVGGVLLVVTPMLAFWVGRSLCDDRTLRNVLVLVAVLAVPAAIYGLVQTFRGFPSWDERWILQSGYVALNVGGTTRAFASFSAASEYAFYLAIGLVGWLAYGLRRLRPVRLPLSLAAVALLGTAIAYESVRGVVVSLVIALGLMAAARSRLPLGVAAMAALVLVATVPFVAAAFVPTGSDAGSQLLAHLLTGLADPFGEASTLPGHLDLMLQGLGSAISHPIGLGIGTVTIAAGKFGGTVSGTEVDPSNVAVALGVPGFLAYLAVVAGGFRSTYRLATRRGDALALVALGVMGVTFLHWLNGGQYAVAFLPWLILGWAERASGELRLASATRPTSVTTNRRENQ